MAELQDGARVRTRICPNCLMRPARDQRATAKDGRCTKCWAKLAERKR